LLVLGACRRSKQDLGGLTFLGANSTVHVVKVSAQVALPVVGAAAQVLADAAAAAAHQAVLDELDECFGL
jgi:hypothetical protein